MFVFLRLTFNMFKYRYLLQNRIKKSQNKNILIISLRLRKGMRFILYLKIYYYSSKIMNIFIVLPI